MPKKIVYIIPTYNERENIGKMLKAVSKVLTKLKKYRFQILVVDDNSPDGTGGIVKKFQVKNKKVLLISGSKNGLGMAMIKGFNHAIKKLRADIVISNEADFSYSPSKVRLMIKKIEQGFDVVAGSRLISNTRKWPLERQITHFLANTIFAGIVAGVHEVEDHNSAFKIIRVQGVLDRINFKNFPKGFAFFNYFIFKLSKTTSKIYEFKTPFYPRTHGESKISFNSRYYQTFIKDSIEYIFNCFRIRFERLNS